MTDLFDRQMKALGRIWGTRTGYVFLPYIDGDSDTKDARRRSYHEGRAFKWPREKEAIRAHLEAHTDDDLYFTPALFNGKRRIEQNVAAERCLWADLDEADPNIGPMLDEYKPTVAWASSPGRYQAVWIMTSPRVGASWAGKENHRLSLFLGADPSGWDSTQLLRIPGWENHKPEYRDKKGRPAKGEILWDNGPRYNWEYLDDLPEVTTSEAQDIELVDEELLNQVDRHEVWARVKLKISRSSREYLAQRELPEGVDRSDVLWQVERDLADAGCSLAEIVVLIRASVWNKYAGRADELKRLKIEAAKAIAEKGDHLESSLDDDVEKPGLPNWGSDWFLTPTPRPKWLVQDIWTEGACGFISGAPKSYKSWMALDLAISVATGLPFLGQYAVKKPGPVLYLQEEDALPLVKERYRYVLEGKDNSMSPYGALGVPNEGDPSTTTQDGVRGARGRSQGRPAVIHEPPSAPVPVDMQVQTGFIASDSAWQEWLEDRVAEYRYRLIVIDTLTTTAGDIDPDRAQELMTKMLKPLKVIAQKHNVAICIVHHNRKGDGTGRAGQDMLGSVALHAWVDCALYARSKDGQAITVDRESKSSTDLRVVVTVPHMHENLSTGERVLWEPSISERGDDVGIDHTDQPTPAKAEVSSTAGKGFALKAKRITKRWIDREELLTIMGGHPDERPKALAGQLTAAVANGYLEADGERVRVRE